MRNLLDRLDDSATGVVMKELETELPAYALPEAKKMAALMKDDLAKKYKMEPGVKFCFEDMEKMYLANTWKANLSVTGAGGLPQYQKAGNVVRPSTSVRLSMRLPPNCDAHKANDEVRKRLTTDVPHNCKVEIAGDHNGNGWCMKDPEPWFHNALNSAAKEFYDGKEYGSYGMGGSIPFLAQLGGLYPDTFIVALGVLGPQSNAHAPDECINLAYVKRLTMAMSHIVCGIDAGKQ
jgi:acetylornithine deacetylase/succinyl-diaminopimelate desuccinylase-like protein